MQNHSSNIELSSQVSDPQIIRRNSGQAPDDQHPLLQGGGEPDTGLQRSQAEPPRSNNSSLENKFKACVTQLLSVDRAKVSTITIFLMTFFMVLDLVPFGFLMFNRPVEISSQEIKAALFSISTNLNTDPIMDLQIVDEKSSCPSGFDLLYMATWHGTTTGCHCENGDLFDSPCKEDQAETCKTVPGNFDYFAISKADSRRWCAKRAVLGTDYAKQAKCPSGFQECYPGGCFANECPITKVGVASKGEASKKFSKSQEKYLILTRRQGELPLISFKITPNDIPCLNHLMSAKYPNGDSPYPLLNYKSNGCGRYGLDEFSTRLDSQSTLDYFPQWKYDDYTRNLPQFLEKAEQTMSVLSWRTRIKTAKDDCCLDLDVPIWLEDPNKIFESSLISRANLMGSIILHMIFLFTFAMFFYSGDHSRVLVKSASDIMWWLKMLVPFYLQIASSIFKQISGYENLMGTKRYWTKLETFDTLECFGESQVGMPIHDYVNLLQKAEINFLMYFGLCLSHGLTLLVCLYCWMVHKKARQREDPENPVENPAEVAGA